MERHVEKIKVACRSVVFSFLHFLVPARYHTDLRDFSRAALCCIIPPLLGIVLFMNAPSFFVHWRLVMIARTCSLLNLSVPVVVRILGSYSVAFMIFLTQMLTLTVLVTAQLGVQVATASGLVFAPMFAVVMVGRKYGFVTLTLCVYLLFAARGIWWFPFGMLGAERTSVSPLVVLRPVFVGYLSVLCTLYVLNKISDRVVAESKMKQETTKQFFSTLCHEMRGPCQSILNGARMFEEVGNLSTAQEISTETVFNGARVLAVLLNDILDYQKIDQKMMKLNSVPTRLIPLLEGAIETACLAVSGKEHVDVILEVDPTVPEVVVCDPERVAQVLIHSMHLSLGRCQEGFVAYRVTAKPKRKNMAEIRFNLTHTAPTLIAEHRQLIREKKELISTKSHPYTGQTLKFDVNWKLCKLMGGGYHVPEPVPGDVVTGLSFFVRLGVVQGPNMGLEEKRKQELHGLRVLLATRRPSLGAHILRILTAWGSVVDEAPTPQLLEAKLSANADRYDVVLISFEYLSRTSIAALVATKRSEIRRAGVQVPFRIVRLVPNGFRTDFDQAPDMSLVRRPLTSSALFSAVARGSTPVRQRFVSASADASRRPSIGSTESQLSRKGSTSSVGSLDDLHQRFGYLMPLRRRETTFSSLSSELWASATPDTSIGGSFRRKRLSFATISDLARTSSLHSFPLVPALASE